MRTILIGKGRRVTLEELQSVALYDAQLEMHASDAAAAATMDVDVDADISAITSALSNVTILISVGNSCCILKHSLRSISHKIESCRPMRIMKQHTNMSLNTWIVKKVVTILVTLLGYMETMGGSVIDALTALVQVGRHCPLNVVVADPLTLRLVLDEKVYGLFPRRV